jgi:hypothetical protein
VKKYLAISLLLLIFSGQSFSQKKDPVQNQRKEPKVIQFSGYAMTADSLMGVPFAHITVQGRGRVATAGPDGFFSFASLEGDTLFFTSVGFKPSVYIIPANLQSDKFSVIQLMSKTSIYLRETVIFPWRREDFHQVFLDTHPPEDDLDRARRNLDRERLAAIGEKLEHDGGELASQSLRNSSANKYYYGQTPPQNIFNPLAWAEFIRAWKNGDFKKKKTSSDSGSGSDDPGN